MGLIAIIFAILNGVFIFIICIYVRNIKNIKQQLSEILRRDTNEKLKLSTPSKSIESLTLEINNLLSIRKEEGILFNKKEKELRMQIANISHDLRTPLTSILGYIQLVNDESTSEDERNQFLSIIETKSKVLQTLITSFYDLSRLEANEYPIELEYVNISEILKEVTVAFYNDFVDKGFEVELDLDEKLPKIIADKKALIRVFTNIIQNALKHGEKTLLISQKKENNEIVTTFSNGVKNLKEEDVDYIFDRFFTGDRMRSGQNTGLGLAIVKKLVETMGFKINAYLQDELFTIKITNTLK